MIYIPSALPHEFLATNSREGERLICIDEKLWGRAKAEDFQYGAYPTPQLSKELLFYLLLNPKTRHLKLILDLFLTTLNG